MRCHVSGLPNSEEKLNLRTHTPLSKSTLLSKINKMHWLRMSAMKFRGLHAFMRRGDEALTQWQLWTAIDIAGCPIIKSIMERF